MKIESAWIDDPLDRGVFDQPELCVSVDELPDETIAAESYEFDDRPGEAWSVGKDGPFVAYEVVHTLRNRKVHEQALAATFNRLFANILPPIVDISLYVEGDRNPYHYALPLKRARQLVKKHSPEWRLLLSDRQAQEGLIKWMPVMVEPVCKMLTTDPIKLDLHPTAVPPAFICGREVYNFALIRGVDVPLCQKHFNINQARFLSRTASR